MSEDTHTIPPAAIPVPFPIPYSLESRFRSDFQEWFQSRAAQRPLGVLSYPWLEQMAWEAFRLGLHAEEPKS